MDNQSANQSSDPSPGYGSSNSPESENTAPGYSAVPNFYGEASSAALGGGTNAWNGQRIENPFQENVFEVNPFDTAYTETLASANPTAPQASPGYSAYTPSFGSDDDQYQLEL
jgi:hypothetical protein